MNIIRVKVIQVLAHMNKKILIKVNNTIIWGIKLLIFKILKIKKISKAILILIFKIQYIIHLLFNKINKKTMEICMKII